ncbi:hypothetical protein COCOBI_06-1220 [Coccomyxa sp. Obi]|nr:hypothetical protein COCOBI_06-1220 [Coccomyxa sp. Obi]
MDGVPDIPERELSLDVLGNLDMCRLDTLGGQRLGSIGNLTSLGSRLGGHGGQRLESLGNLESLGKLGLETFGQRLESISRGDLSSNSLEGISRQLLGSLPENDPALNAMLEAAVPSQPQGCSPTQGRSQGAVNMDLLNAWGSLSDMTTLEQRAGEFTINAAPLQSYSRMGGNEYGGHGFSFGSAGGMRGEDAEMRDAQHSPEAQRQADARFGLKDTQMRNGHAPYQQQQQQHFPYGVGSEAFWDPISEPQSFKFNSNFNSGGQQQQQQQHRQEQ